MKIKNSIRLVALIAVFALLMLSAAAATWDEMYENGVVSDGDVRFGDARDGVVSDVSEPTPGEAHRIRNGYGTQMSDGGNDNATGSVTGDNFGLNDDNIMPGRSGAESGSAASSTEMTDTAAAFATQLAGATGAFDLVCFDYYWKLEQQGYFYDLATMDGIDLTQSYWYHGWNNNTTINGVAYTAVGDASLEVLQNIEVMFFNRTMATGHDLDLYGLVDDNQWTVDKLMEVNASVAQNLDDANAQNQIYGALYDRHSFRAALFAAGLKLTEMAENGAVQIIADRQTNYDIADKISALIHSKEVDFADINCRVRDWSLFKNGQALFFATALFRGNELRTANLTFDYGIVVAPKFTEEDKYVSTNYGASVFGIPLDCRDAKMSALILSALNYYSTDSVVNLLRSGSASARR